MFSGKMIVTILVVWFIFTFLFTFLKKKSGKGSKLEIWEIILALVVSVPLVLILLAVHLI
ncbi:Uncharacterised protein [Sebaldella termitidis]|jgi:hypothetical protein|uniref:Uncharacterized protein n=2 Tax=Sebaldella TaxID=32068 RepID=D1AKA2_SEBTE|nr:hypothetical protein [Sebaldella termitidis]ACZ09018.1 hypothetical protein Sterm_2164 [Sebaldella termitidis ATCC 33386]SUI24337.1 Uncharacterised protein [Sebaldella termitidis]